MERALTKATLPLDADEILRVCRSPAGLAGQRLLEDTEGIELVATYVPAGRDRPVSGDWYDAFATGTSAVTLSVGDACGHGVQAAGLSVQARNAIRALSFHGVHPAASLATTSRTLTTGNSDFATCILMSYSLPDQRLSWARAGHPPPILKRGGDAWLLTEGGGVPVGLFPDSGYAQAELTLRRGDLLVLYTDGLIERPGTPLDVSIDELRSLSADAAVFSAAALDEVLRSALVPPCPRDDICLLVARVC